MAKIVYDCNFSCFNGRRNRRTKGHKNRRLSQCTIENRRFLKLCCGRKSAFFKRNQSIIALTAQAGAQAPRPTRLSVKSSPAGDRTKDFSSWKPACCLRGLKPSPHALWLPLSMGSSTAPELTGVCGALLPRAQTPAEQNCRPPA